MMNNEQQQRSDYLYEQHVTHLTLQGKRPATIDGYSRALRRITHHLDKSPDTLTTDDLKRYFAQLIKPIHGAPSELIVMDYSFSLKHVLQRDWEWLNIVKPPQVKTLPDILTPVEVSHLINSTKQVRYQVFFSDLV